MKKDICKICGFESDLLFTGRILNKYDISYFKCPHCEFIQTEKPYWIEEAYNSAIADMDTGYVSRNLIYKDFVSSFILQNKQFDADGRFLDYGGGYGLFVRLMRDKGYDFYREDLFCQNIFAKHFDIEDIVVNDSFEMLTCFEVFEHLVEPLSEIEKMLSFSKSIFFSTEMQPNKELKSLDDWWYFAPETGQHVALYTRKTLEFIAKKYQLNLYSNNTSIHLLTDKTLDDDCFNKKPNAKKSPYLIRIYRRLFGKKVNNNVNHLKERESYTWKDFQYIKSILNNKSI